MDSYFEKSSRNPWKDERDHPSDKFLELRSRAQYGGLLSRDELEMKCNESSLLRGASGIEQAEEARQNLSKIKRRCLELSLENRAADLLRSEELKTKLKNIETLLQSFETCVTKVQKLQQTLMQPFQGNFMKIEHKHHKNVIDLFTNSVKMLDGLKTELDVLEWHKENAFDGPELRRVLETLSKCVAELEKDLEVTEKSKTILDEKSFIS